MQVSPVLVRVTDGTTRWAGEPTVVAPADAFTVQGTLASEVADALDVALAPAERARLATVLTRDTVAFAAVERGRRIMQASDSIPLQQRLRRALPEFEAAYEREPAAAAGWAEASYVLQRMGQVASSTTLIDSAAVLARAALALDPGNAQAVNTIAIFESAHARIQAYRAVIERAVRAHPSSAELRVILALVQYETGQADRAWPSALAALQLAPRSTHVIDRSLRVALALRRYGDARELVARRQALDPTSAISDAQATQVAAVVGDTSGVARAVRAYQAKGGQLLASSVPFNYLRLGDKANRDMLLTGTPATFGALDAFDTLRVYMQQMNLLMQRGDSVRARPLLTHALALTARIANAAPPRLKATLGLQVAWFAAARGDRAGANLALTSYANTYAAELRDAPGGIEDAVLTCTRAEVAGLVGDVAAMLTPLRQCLTMPNGYDLVTLRTELAFTRHAADPRPLALAAELAAAEERARNTPVQTSR